MSACKKRKISEGGFPAILSRAGKEKYGEDLNSALNLMILSLLVPSYATSIHLLAWCHGPE